jgi:hypothetical protein
MSVFAWMKKKLKKIPEGREVYDSVRPIAEGAKAIVQMTIGIIALIVLIVQLCIHLPASAASLGDRALAIVGAALAFSAAVELAYTFFTDGPDEALDPLILGLSSFGLIEISRSEAHLNTVAIPILLIAIAIVVLFAARKFLLEVRKEASAETKDVMPPDSYLG